MGELVDADNANYNSFKELLLVCPHCDSSVYLSRSHGRVATTRHLASGKAVTIRASAIPNFFSHHSRAEACEIKDRNITPERVQQALNIARGQRAKVFRSRALEILMTSRVMELLASSGPNVVKDIGRIKKTGVISCNISATLCTPSVNLDFDFKPICKVIEECVNWPYHTWEKLCMDEQLFEVYEEQLGERDKIGDYATQLSYTKEFLRTMYAKSNRRLLYTLYTAIAAQLCCTRAVKDGHSILKSPKFLERSFDRQVGVKALQRMLNKELLNDLREAILVSPDGEDLGLRLPFIYLVLSLMTVGWENLLKQDLPDV